VSHKRSGDDVTLKERHGFSISNTIASVIDAGQSTYERALVIIREPISVNCEH
jgi:hypothetical protein